MHLLDNKLVLESLGNVLRSPGFARAPRLSRLLRYIVEHSLAGRRDDLKEYAIALEVFDRDSSYDPQADSTVRVEVSKLRARLAEYYARPDVQDPVRFEIPKGAYLAEIHPATPEPAPEPSPIAPTPEPTRRRWLWGAGGVSVAGAAVAVGVYRGNSRDLPSVGALPLPSESAMRGGNSPEAGQALNQLARLLPDAGVPVLSAPQRATRFQATVRVGRSWSKPAAIDIVAEIRDLDRAAPLWSKVWQGDPGRLPSAAAAELAAALLRIRESSLSDLPDARALQAYHEALALLGEGKSFVVQTAREKAGRAPLDTLLNCVTLLEQALRLDSGFSEARAKLAWVYHLAAEYDAGLQPKVRQAAEAALSSGVPAEANYVLGYQNLFFDWNPAEARNNFAACVSRAAFHHDAARLHTDATCICRRGPDAQRLLEPLLSVQPRSAVLRAAAFLLAENLRDFAEMERLANESLSWSPAASIFYWQLGQAKRAQGLLSEAETHFRAGLEKDPGSKRLLFALCRLCIAQGRGREASALLQQASLERSNPSLLAVLEMEQGRPARAAEWLRKAVQQHEISLCYLALDPVLASFQSNPITAPILQAVHIPPATA